MLDVRGARHALTTTDPSASPPGPPLPEIAFVGRSNVGKSTLINHLTRRRSLARTSGKPGKTQTINYYAIGDRCHFVDLPGYGYAEVPETVRRSWAPMIEAYLDTSKRLVGIVSLIDGRRPPTTLDEEMIAWLGGRETPTLIVLTKGDKVPRGRRRESTRTAVERLGLSEEQVLWFSARDDEGREAILTALAELLGEVPC